MKKTEFLFAGFAMLLLSAGCADKSADLEALMQERFRNRSLISYEVIRGDTLNGSDAMDRKQGHWRTIEQISGQPVEEGDYLDGHKHGWWMYYDSSGRLMRKVHYKNDWVQ